MYHLHDVLVHVFVRCFANKPSQKIFSVISCLKANKNIQKTPSVTGVIIYSVTISLLTVKKYISRETNFGTKGAHWKTLNRTRDFQLLCVYCKCLYKCLMFNGSFVIFRF